MLENRVVTGKVIDIRNDKVLTLHGDMVSTFDMKYYVLMEDEPFPIHEGLSEASLPAGLPEGDAAHAEAPGWFRRDWKPLLNLITAWRKSANRA
ncbi:hypothetical protein BBD41_11295 [Paenibacillus ihbetae]|uniref:Uncharacterized protein n=1 Tax=Paenibacillus ihbetae TaxID=1870820 RepID=A0A1B2E9A8_9BACL|nr:hypothetical protein [Paenibacillus ihbetae]ANY76529.1 hypothetical protein BBD41_11295 [Paenibacillus ihbetae]